MAGGAVLTSVGAGAAASGSAAAGVAGVSVAAAASVRGDSACGLALVSGTLSGTTSGAGTGGVLTCWAMRVRGRCTAGVGATAATGAGAVSIRVCKVLTRAGGVFSSKSSAPEMPSKSSRCNTSAVPVSHSSVRRAGRPDAGGLGVMSVRCDTAFRQMRVRTDASPDRWTVGWRSGAALGRRGRSSRCQRWPMNRARPHPGPGDRRRRTPVRKSPKCRAARR